MAAVPWRQARQDTGSVDVVAPPPPPPTLNGHIPTIRLQSEIPDTMDPPPCVQNAMMTKDKKPFTYTPGGIDLSEVRSPRMQRRIERNANLGGVGDLPQPQQYSPQPVGPLPPSALAAMQPQMHVQVFPTGEKPVLPSKAPAPPPLPPSGPPPPPPPPTQPLPTQKCITADNQVIERPDMTKIIPENPMALLRKSPGPQRKSFVEQLNDVGPVTQQPTVPFAVKPQSPPAAAAAAANRRSFVDELDNVTGAPPPVVQMRPVQNNTANRRSFVDEVESFSPPAQPQPRPFVQAQPKSPPASVQPPTKASSANVGSLYIPPVNSQTASGSPPTPPERNTPSIQSPISATLNKAPRPWQKQQQKQEELPPWAVREQKPVQEIEKQPSVPAQQPRWPQNQAAKSPPLQQQNRWGQSVENNQQPVQQQPQSRWAPQNEFQQTKPQSPPARQQQLRSPPIQQQSPAGGTNMVFISQPQVFQHPGGTQQQQQQQQQQRVNVVQRQPQQQQPGVRIIPIKIESNQGSNSPTSPVTPGARSFNRQQSWSNNPTQSNSFRVIQKITNTDDDVDEDAPVTEHGPKTPRQFQQPPPQTQLGRVKISDGADRELVNRFKQEFFISDEDPRYRGGHIPSRIFWMLEESGDEENSSSLHNEVDPRYRGAAIPSKAFRLLQSMTGPEDANAPVGVATIKVVPAPAPAPASSVPRTQPPNRQPQVVRTIPVQIEADGPPQAYVHPSQQTQAPEPKKYTGGSIPSRSFKILQAMTAPESANANHDTSSNETWEQYPQNYPPPYYWHDYYWPYYYHPTYLDPNDPSRAANQETEPEIAQYYAYPPPWYPYPYWGYPPYSPYPFCYPEDTANYEQQEKSEDDKRKDCGTPQIVVTTDTETETENEDAVNIYSVNSLQTIKSVSNIKIYEEKKPEAVEEIVEEPETEDSSDDDDDEDCQSVYVVDEDTNPHQLSTIYEESERSDRMIRESSVTTTVSEDFTYHAEEKKQEVEEEEQDWWGIINNQSDFAQNDCDNTNTANDETGTVIEVAVEEKEEGVEGEENQNYSEVEEEEEVDFWSEIIADRNSQEDIRKAEEDDEDSSASSSDSSCSMSKASRKIEDEVEDDSSSSSDDDDDDDDDDENNNLPDEKEKSATPPSIKERIKALQNSEKPIQRQEDEPPKISVKERISAFENQTKHKSTEDNSEEEMDSGVTSDVSRHTDTDEFPELRKMTKYQRAATHSRLFKLLQDECDNEDDEEEAEEIEDRKALLQRTSERIAARSREHLTLPLKNLSEPESFSSSGINSPGSGEFINERLVNELIQSMLKRKKGQMLRAMPLEKLHAAAVRILQEDMDGFDTSSDDCSSFLSPLKTGTQSSTPAQTPQEFYSEYKQYYETWNDADASAEIIPSKAFKFLQEHKPVGFFAKCPRVLSSKNVNKELSKLLEGVESPDKDDRKEATSAS